MRPPGVPRASKVRNKGKEIIIPAWPGQGVDREGGLVEKSMTQGVQAGRGGSKGEWARQPRFVAH